MALAIALGSGGVAASADRASYRAPRTAYGAPDLQGIWSNASLTSLERPRQAASLIVSAAEAVTLERQLIEDREKFSSGIAVGQYEAEWLEDVDYLARMGGQARTSWIVSPADGKLPYTGEGRREFGARQRAYVMGFDGPEARPAVERCLSSGMGSGGAPILNQVSAALYTIIQSRDEIAIVSESNHEARIVRLRSGHLPNQMRVWMGDSIGHWDHETLVVESTNFRGDEADRFQMVLPGDAKVTERFTRVSATEILYEFTVEDPVNCTQAWRAEMPFVASKGPVYEFACHEGNYALPGILAGAPRDAALAKAKSPSPGR